MSQYLLKNGYQMAYLEEYICEHYEGTANQEKRFPEYFERRKVEKRTKYNRSYEEIQEAESAYSTGTVWGERVVDTINRVRPYLQGRILDIGCNDGLSLKCFGELGFVATGVDISATKVKLAKDKGLYAEQAVMEELPCIDKGFDTIFCSHTLEHSNDLNKAVAEIQRVGKRLILVVPIEDESKNPAHISPFTNPEEVKALFKGKVLHEEGLMRMEREYLLVMDLE